MTGLRRVVLGEAGRLPALILAGMALVIAFIVTAGPLALTAAGDRATMQALALAPRPDLGVQITADAPTASGAGVLDADVVGKLATAFGNRLPLPDKFPAAARWANVSVPQLRVQNAAPSAVAASLPVMEVDYRSALAASSVLVAGTLPRAAGPARPRNRRSTGSITLTIAATTAVAARFSLHVGSVLNLGQANPVGPDIKLKVTGIVRPVRLSSAFWQFEPILAKPTLTGPSATPYWLAAVFTGPGDLAALATAYSGEPERVTWFYPLRTDLTSAQVPRLEGQIAALASSAAPRAAEDAVSAQFLQNTTVTTSLAAGLSSFTAQWQSTAGADSLLVTGLFAAGLVLLLVSSAMAMQAYESELILIRVRGGGLSQIARRMLARSSIITVPALIAGAALAIGAVPGPAVSSGAFLQAALVALAAVTGMPLLCVLTHRKPRTAARGRGDEVASRISLRRLTIEVLVIVVACAAIADLRYRGSGLYLSVSAVLVALVVGLLVNHAYRGPLRALARAAAGGKGPVGPVGLARAAASVTSPWPGLALMLALTLAAFCVMVSASVTAGQVAASWAQVGGDAAIAVHGSASAVSAGKSPMTAADLRAISQVPGVRHLTTVYTAQNQGPFAVELQYGQATSPALGVAVVDPGSYAALAAGTPWPDFPAAALARPGGSGGAGAAVPILVSPSVAAAAARHGAAGRSGLRLSFAGISVPARIAGVIAQTAAMPAGGSYVLLPHWAAGRLPSLPQPSTILLTGTSLNAPALRATVHRVLPHSQLALRGLVLRELVNTPVLRMSAWLYLIGAVAAIVLSALAVLFALAGSARSRGLMMTRLAALGMDRTQALLLAVTDAIPLISVAIVGTVASSWLLAEVVGPVLGLNVFTGSAVPVVLRPTWLALTVPLAGVAVLTVATLAADSVARRRRQVGAALRLEEAY